MPDSILDVGCGGGSTLSVLRQRWPRATIDGLDWSKDALAIASKREPTAGFILADLRTYEPHRRYDLVTALGILEHFADPSWAIEKLRRLVSPGGLIYLEIPNNLSYSFSSLEEGYRRLAGASRQFEWHLHRDFWNKILGQVSMHVLAEIVGPLPEYEFIWILRTQRVSLSDRTRQRLRRIQYWHKIYGVLRSMPRRAKWAIQQRSQKGSQAVIEE